MRTKQNTKNVAVGLFVFIAVALFAMALLVLGRQKNTFGDTFTAKTYFANAEGLKKGANVFFAGVKIGTVKEITLQPGNKVEILMNIEEDKKSLLPKDVIATIGGNGLIGSRSVDLNGGNIQAGHLADGSIIKSEQGASLSDMFATLQTNNNNLVAITTDLKQVSKKVLNGEGSVGKLINDPSLANNMQALVNKLQVSANNAQTLTKDITAFTSKLEKPGTMTYNVINDTVIFSRLRSTSRQLNAMANDAQTVVNKLNNTADKLNDTNKPAGMILNDKQTADDLKNVINNLQTGTEKLNQTLDALRHNFLLKGSFRKMEKERAKDTVK